MHLNHIAIVVENIPVALEFWHTALGLPINKIELNTDEAVEIAFLPFTDGHGEIELIAPTDPETGVARYLAKRGSGLHHICLEVDDLDAKMRDLAVRGVELINDTAKTNVEGRRYCFIHPRATFGVLLELYEK